MKTSILILAAGLGTRMKSEKPKVLQELCQKSMILHILEKAFAISEDVSVVLSHQKERVEKEILKHFPKTQNFRTRFDQFPRHCGRFKGI